MTQHSDWGDFPLTSAVATAITTLTVGLAMSLLFIGWSNFWILFVIGFACVLPVATQVTYWYETRAGDRNRDQNTSENSDQHGALETLRERYASGDIDEREFERRVERLVKTESVADAETAYRNTDRSSDEPSRQVERDY